MFSLKWNAYVTIFLFFNLFWLKKSKLSSTCLKELKNKYKLNKL